MLATENRYDTLLARFNANEFPPLIIAIGLGDAQLLEAVERRSPTAKVLVLEPRPGSLATLPARAKAWLESGRLTLLAGPDYQGRADAWRLIDRAALKPPMLVSPSLERDFPAETAAAKGVARQIVLGAQANDEARRRFSGPYLLNTIGNIAAIAGEGNVARLEGLFPGFAAVVVAAGPSLDANLPALLKIKDRVIVIAVDTAVRPLLAAGIAPHLIVGVDPSEDNARHLRGLPVLRGSWFVGEGSLPPDIFEYFAGRSFVYRVANHHPWPWLNEHGLDCGKLAAWGSVITTTFDLACRLGCNPVVFAGADLAYTGGLPYCRNTVYEHEWKHLGTDAARAEEFKPFLAKKGTVEQIDIHGQRIVTAPRFVQFRDWLTARSAQPGMPRVVNATGGGILHGGAIEQASLDSLRLLAPALSAEDVQRRFIAAWNGTDRIGGADRVKAALETFSPAAVAAWLLECGETAGPEEIVAARAAARKRAAGFCSRRAYEVAQRTFHDSRIASVEDAQQLSHHDYATARYHAPVRKAHILLDYLSRSYPIETPAGIQPLLGAMAELPTGIRVLDFGCGTGAGMEPLAEAGIRVDGVDVSAQMIAMARQNPRLGASEFFLGRGDDCGDVPDGAYDLIYSNTCFPFMCARGLRRSILRAMARALRPGGVVVIHFRFHPGRRSNEVPVPWTFDNLYAQKPGTDQEVWPTPDAMPLIYEDFSRLFVDVRMQVVDLAPTAHDRRPAQLIVSGSTARTLGPRLHPRVPA